MSKQFPSPHEDFLGANLTTSRLTLTVKRFRPLARIRGGLTKAKAAGLTVEQEVSVPSRGLGGG